MRLIDADAMIDKYGDYYTEEGPEHGFIGSVKTLVDMMPTIEERKSGRWARLHGFCTPGGDPVWACSECGKGIHVYGIEHGTYGSDISDGQWKACPNCGAVMTGEA